MKEYYTIKDITEPIIKELRFIVQKRQKPTDVVSEFLLEVAEGFFPLFKKEGLTKEQIIFQRFQRNYLIDYYKKIRGKETFELSDNIPYEEDDGFDDLKEILRFYNLCSSNEERLVILCELWRNYQEKHSKLEDNFVNNISEHAKLVIDLFEMPKYFTTYMLNYSQCQIALGSPTSDEYREMKQKLYRKLRKYESVLC